jgi:16S rRNA (adenine1518-N6/adenine1519-N6)-dimethyltransferase
MATSYLANPSATIAVLERHGLYTKKSLGQHFLVDDNVLGRMLDLAALSGDEIVLEVGPGIGTLTVALCAAAGAVVAVERDGDLERVIAETAAECQRFALIRADAVVVSPDVVSAPFGVPDALVANLPYGVAATVVLRFFETMPSLSQATVMVQAEVADRMAAVPGTKAYGSYSVKLQLLTRPAGRISVAPGCFLPPPRVHSAVIRLERLEAPWDPELRRRAARVADAAFAQRRKTLRNSLKAASGLEPRVIDAALEAAGIDGTLRAETLAPEAFVDIARQLPGAGISAAHRLY